MEIYTGCDKGTFFRQNNRYGGRIIGRRGGRKDDFSTEGKLNSYQGVFVGWLVCCNAASIITERRVAFKELGI